MKLILIPAFRIEEDPPEVGDFYVRELLAELEKKGGLDGVEVDVDVGTVRGWDAVSSTALPANNLKRVQMYCDGSEYDAIVLTNGGDYGLAAARTISKIPVTGIVQSSIHVASLIGDRFTILYHIDRLANEVRHLVSLYGLDHKLASARSFDMTNPPMWETVRTCKKGERGKSPQGKEIIDKITAQCISAIEEDRADSIIINGPHHACFADEVRLKLDDAGYSEVPIILGVHAGVEMAKTLVDMRLKQSALWTAHRNRRPQSQCDFPAGLSLH